MYMYETKYHRPKTLAEAAEIYSNTEEPAYLSGGHTLIPAMKGRLAAPANLIDVRRIPELSGIRIEADRVIIGSATTHAAVAASKEIAAVIPALSGLAGSIADVQVRHVGTIGGSVANNDPAADYPSAVLGLDATVHTDRRAIASRRLFCRPLYDSARRGRDSRPAGIQDPRNRRLCQVPQSRLALCFGGSLRRQASRWPCPSCALPVPAIPAYSAGRQRKKR